MLSRQKCELVVGEGEAVLLSSKGLPYDGVNLHVLDVDAGNHVGLHWGDPTKESLGGLTVTGPLDLVDRARNLLKLSLPGVCQADTIISSWPVMSLVMGKRPRMGWLNQ